jgi:hypothetical protein
MGRIKGLWDDILGSFNNKIIKFKKPIIKCSFCEVKKATWKHSIVSDYVCDSCVPRGCSCTLYKKVKRATFLIADYDYQKDNQGNDLPCEEWEKL